MKSKLKIYIDTSVLNFYFADEEPKGKRTTREFLKGVRAGKYDTFISVVVIRELDETGEPKRTKLLGLVEKYQLKILHMTPECENLADRYVKDGIIPLRYRDDAVHIAVAVINGVELLVSWNLKHMVKLKTINSVNAISRELGYKLIDIITPEEALP